MNKEITKIIRQYPKTDDCKFETLGELHKWQIKEITELIKQAEDGVNDDEWSSGFMDGNDKCVQIVKDKITGDLTSTEEHLLINILKEISEY